MTSSPTLAEATHVLKSGGVLAYPTEAVWGLGCDPNNEAAVIRLLAIKQRPVDKGLILIAANLDQLRPYLDLPALPSERLAEVLATWPGPHTWVMPAHRQAPRWITGAHDGIAVRVSAHPIVVALCLAFGGPLVSTSANAAGAPPPRTRGEFDPGLLAAVDGIMDGDTTGLARPTPIRDARTGAELRA
ncbi:Sua5/YciO/YrdC/YwlC family protein [Luteimonas sp. SX5]|uniref:Threonylcarbamoyl-AMP synthase n=1 Tax=Luteimonas galliterrae TaxID=2940486 RepID=A0ABT0ML38_9GAMM|nr:Sua5/YciO/YrdC/YwlC family protein [Luteimonas galliterrae]MCL1634960.1 Sua5/YciO/YrdC/YwlC family protein [Luteimonas galliterrae]